MRAESERWQSGRLYLTRNQAYVHSVPWVRIPPSPPKIQKAPSGPFLFLAQWARMSTTRVRLIGRIADQHAEGARRARAMDGPSASHPLNAKARSPIGAFFIFCAVGSDEHHAGSTDRQDCRSARRRRPKGEGHGWPKCIPPSQRQGTIPLGAFFVFCAVGSDEIHAGSTIRQDCRIARIDPCFGRRCALATVGEIEMAIEAA
jgi:hypothetical protein